VKGQLGACTVKRAEGTAICRSLFKDIYTEPLTVLLYTGNQPVSAENENDSQKISVRIK
jgi:hypothetical protein